MILVDIENDWSSAVLASAVPAYESDCGRLVPARLGVLGRLETQIKYTPIASVTALL